MDEGTQKLLLLPGDGIGPEVIAEAAKVLRVLNAGGLQLQVTEGLIGGAAYERHGKPLPDETLDAALASDAVMMGAVGGPKYDGLDRGLRPESGLLAVRKELDLFANLRPVQCYAALADASTLKREIVSGLDLLIVRELTGGIYFGKPRGVHRNADGVRSGVNTLSYNEHEIERIARVAFDAAMGRNRLLCSVDKANVLEVSGLWREVVESVACDYPEVRLSHIYVDNAAMQLVLNPAQFDVLVTSNMFGDILSDLAAMLTGSIGMLPSASVNARGKGLYEPVHGSAPDLAGTQQANPLAAILSLAMALRYSLGQPNAAVCVEKAVKSAIGEARTADLSSEGRLVTTSEMGDLVVAYLEEYTT